MTWLWIIVAFIAGAIIAHWLTKRACEEEHRSIEGSTSRIASLPDLEPASEEESSAVTDPESAPAESATVADVEPDDLRKIEGIGPKIAELMNGDGIMTFAQMAESPVERLQTILDSAGERYRVHNPASWPMQAGLAAEGKWDELDELQDRLDGGKL